MRRATAALVVPLLLAACHRAPVADAPDAAADLRARTAAKTSADIAAAEAAARGPLPRAPAPAAPRRSPERAEASSGTPAEPDNDRDPRGT